MMEAVAGTDGIALALLPRQSGPDLPKKFQTKDASLLLAHTPRRHACLVVISIFMALLKSHI
jgi:hypothetical protein